MGHLRSPFREKQWKNGSHNADAHKRETADNQHHRSTEEICTRQINLQDLSHHRQNNPGEQQCINHREDRLAGHVGYPPHRSHEGIFNCSLPTLDTDQFRDPVKDRRQEPPDQCPDQQIDHHIFTVDILSTANFFHS